MNLINHEAIYLSLVRQLVHDAHESGRFDEALRCEIDELNPEFTDRPIQFLYLILLLL